MYKKGDKVEVIDDSHGHRMRKGLIGVISEVIRPGTESAMYKIRNTTTMEAKWCPKQDLKLHKTKSAKVTQEVQATPTQPIHRTPDPNISRPVIGKREKDRLGR